MSSVSVIIVNWNGEKFLERCLTALTAQTVKPDQIILLDNASTDNSVSVARKFPELQILMSEQNTGFARGNNLAFQAVSPQSEWIALVNPDAFVDSHWLEELLAASKRNPEFDTFASKLVNAANPALLDGVGDAYHISGLVWRIGHGKPASVISETEHEVFSPCAAAALYRHSIIKQMDGFDEDYFCYVEDVDLGFRLQLKGHRCLYIPKAIVHHVGSGLTGGQKSQFSLYYGHRNLVWTYVKNMPSLLFWLLLPLHLALNLLTIIWFGIAGQGKVMLKAKYDAMKKLPYIWRKRRHIQQSRMVSINHVWRLLSKF